VANDKSTPVKSRKLWPIIWAVITFVLGFVGFATIKPQFDVFVEPLEIKVQQGGRETIKASVENTSLIGLPYKKPVDLEAQNQWPDIKVSISPDAPTVPEFECAITIEVGRNVASGRYKITLIATSTSGTSESADFFIIVIPPICASPFVRDVEEHFAPNGWMCNIADIRMDARNTNNPHSGPTCIKIDYLARIRTPCQTDGWIGAGVYWFCIGCNFDKNRPDPTRYDFSCARSLVFMARGARGGERAEFKVGGVTGQYSDGLNPARTTGPVTLTNQWTQYRIDFNPGDNLTSMISGFCWVTNRDWNPNGCTIYLDDIKFVDR